MAAEEDELANLRGDEKIIKEAKQRFARCQSWEAEARKLFIADLKFVNGDSDNNYQWPDTIRNYRSSQTSPAPCLTINKVAKHCDMIINDGKQNKASVKIRPVSDDATFDAAQVFQDIVYHVEYISRAPAVYDLASEFQVQCGVGYAILSTDYVHNDSFDQEIYICPVQNPLSIYLDPDYKQPDGSDSRFGFEFDDMPRNEYVAQYKKFIGEASGAPLDNADMWETEHHVRVAKYHRKEPSDKPDELIGFTDKAGNDKVIRASLLKLDPGGADMLETLREQAKDPNSGTKIRKIFEDKVCWYKIAGNKIIDRGDWAGSEIPIIPFIGKQTVIDGVMDRKGHTRAMKDAQRMYNYNASAAVEFVAGQGKSPYIADIRAIEGHETYWAAANVTNFAVLPYNGVDSDGNPVPKPERADPPQSSPGYLQGMATASEQLMMSSGQYQAATGQNENTTSGVHLDKRQRQGDNATYHFVDNQALAIARIGRNIVELAPKIYDTKRILKIQAQDGTEKNILIDPSAKEAYFQKRQQAGEAVQAIFNPNVGRYDVRADVGPSFATKRQEAFNMFERLMASDPALFDKYGDLMMRACDAPMADELADRIRRGVPPALLGEAPPPAVIELQQQVQNLTALLKHATDLVAENALKLQSKQAKIEGAAAQKDIDIYDAESRRVTALGNVPPEISAEMIMPALRQALMEMMATPIAPIQAAAGVMMQQGEQTLPQ